MQASLDRSNSLTSGHRACQGCGEALGARYAIDAAMRASDRKLIAVNATGCLEVFTTPYPETSWQIPWMHSLFGNAAAVATGVAAAMRVLGRERDAGRRAGRRRRHDRHRLRLPLRHVRAQRRRALHLLRQRRLHEHRRAALLRDAAGRPHRDHACGGPGAGQRVRHRQVRPEDRDRARHSLSSPRRAWPTCTTSRPRCSKAMGIRGARYIQIHVPCPLGWGAAVARHDQARPPRHRDRPVSDLRGRARLGHRTCARSAARRR